MKWGRQIRLVLMTFILMMLSCSSFATTVGGPPQCRIRVSNKTSYHLLVEYGLKEPNRIFMSFFDLGTLPPNMEIHIREDCQYRQVTIKTTIDKEKSENAFSIGEKPIISIVPLIQGEVSTYTFKPIRDMMYFLNMLPSKQAD